MAAASSSGLIGLIRYPWMGRSVAFSIRSRSLKAVRRRPREVLVVKCSEIGFVAACLAPVEGAYWMFMSEEEIRGLIVSRPESFLGERIRFLEKEKSLGEEGFAHAYGYDEKGNAREIGGP